MPKRLLLIHPEGNFNNNPNLNGLIQLICLQGYEVDILAPRRHELNQETPCANARVCLVDILGGGLRDYTVLFPSYPPNPVEDHRDWVNKAIDQYDLVIGVDRGIIEASIIGRIRQIPYGLISYEICFREETGQEFKAPEIEACEGVAFAVCQDRARSALLAVENQIPLHKLIHIPVAGRGLCRVERSYFLHEELGISKEKMIALYMGELGAAWSGIAELFESMREASDQWVLVLHHRYGTAGDRELRERLARSRQPNILISPLQTLPLDQMHKLVSNADIGIAFYIPMPGNITANNNLRFIGMASGKTATYLQHGVPVIMNEVGEMSDHIRANNLGVVVPSVSALGQTLSALSQTNILEMRDPCYRYFSESLDLEVTSRAFLKKLQTILQ